MQPKDCPDPNCRPHRVAVPAGEHFPAMVTGLIVEAAMRGKRARDWMKQVIRRAGRRHLLGQLPAVAGAGQIAVDQAGGDPICQDRLDGGKADPGLPARVKGGEINGTRRNFGLKNRRD